MNHFVCINCVRDARTLLLFLIADRGLPYYPRPMMRILVSAFRTRKIRILDGQIV